jgi:hypothetical protein
MKGVQPFLSNLRTFDELCGAVAVGGTLALSRILRWFDINVVGSPVNGSAGCPYLHEL